MGGHYVRREAWQNILRTRLWWPTLHQDSKAYYKACDVCQRTGRPLQRDELHHSAPREEDGVEVHYHHDRVFDLMGGGKTCKGLYRNDCCEVPLSTTSP